MKAIGQGSKLFPNPTDSLLKHKHLLSEAHFVEKMGQDEAHPFGRASHSAEGFKKGQRRREELEKHKFHLLRSLCLLEANGPMYGLATSLPLRQMADYVNEALLQNSDMKMCKQSVTAESHQCI